MATGTQFEIGLAVSGAGAASAAADVTARLATALEAAGVAATAAANAVKAGEASYKQAENAADRAAKAVEKIGLAAEAQRGKMKAALDAGDGAAYARAAGAAEKLNQRQAEAVEKARAAKAALDAEATALDRLKAAASGASATQDKLSKAQDQAKRTAAAVQKSAPAGVTPKVNELAEAFGKLGGPLGNVGSKAFGTAEGLKKLAGSLGTAGGAYAAIAIAVVAVTTAIIAGTVAILAYAIGLSDAARTQGLLTAGIAGSVAGGAELAAQIDSLSSRVPQTSEELRAMAADLAKTGLKGKALGEALESAAVKAAEAKFGPEWSKQMTSLSKSGELFKKNIAGLFGGLNLEGLLSGLSKIVAMFDSTSVTGRAIKVVFESLFQPLVDGLAALAPKVVSTFIQFEIWVLKALIAIKPFGSSILMVAKVVGGAALVIGGVLAAAAVVVVGLGMAMMGLVAGALYLGARLIGLAVDAGLFAAKLIAEPGAAVDWLTAKFNQVVAFLQGISLSDIGKALIDGLVQGITGAAGAVLAAMTGSVTGAIDGAKKLLGIASPSKVFAEIGTQTGAGMVEGVEGAAGGVQSSLESMVAPPDASVPAATATASGGGNVFHLTINAPTGEAGSIASAVRTVIRDLLDGDLTQVSGGEPA